MTEVTHQSSVARRLYTSHFLSAWNSRTFEFGAVLFLSAIFPGTLLYASIYALVRALAATLFSSRVGSYVDGSDRLVSIRQSIVWQRLSVALSCVLLLVLFFAPHSALVFWLCFPAAIILACFEKLASIGNTVAIERDWVIVVCDNTELPRQDLNATLRRIDLFCKLVAPVFISFTDAYSTGIAIVVVFGMSTISTFVEYIAIAQVYHAVPDLSKKTPSSTQPDNADLEMSIGASAIHQDNIISPQALSKSMISAIQPWINYCTSPVFLASLALSILYLTVLSTGIQYQTYMLAIGYSSITVSLLRVAAVISELAATCFAPLLTDRIGPIRSGLWSINWQVMWLSGAVVAFICFEDKPIIAGAGLTAGIVASRLGLWGFDLSVQFIVQEEAPEASRGRFSATEVALQNFFELLSFASTIIFARPEQFRYPIYVSYGAVLVAAACFAAFVRLKRGHLLHMSKCVKREKYHPVAQEELAEESSEITLVDRDSV